MKSKIIFTTIFVVCSLHIAWAQKIVWASSVSYDNEISNKDGYNARKAAGPPDAEMYGKYSKGAATLNLNKKSALWLEFAESIETKQILILENNGAGNILKVELVDAITGSTFAVYENPISNVAANYRLTRIVLPDNSLKAKQIKIKFSASKENQQIDAIGVTSAADEFTLADVLKSYAKNQPKFYNEGNNEALNNFVFNYDPANVNVLSIKKSDGSLGEPLKPGESGNLGRMVNTQYSELGPLVAPDEQTIYFIREGDPRNTFSANTESQDIWYTEFDKNTKTWNEAKHMDYPFNKAIINSFEGVTPDGNTFLIKGIFKDGIKQSGRIGFSFSNRIKNGWSNPEPIDIKGFENMYRGKYLSAYLANDSKTILISFSEESGDPNSDIYVTFQKEGNKWTKPINLGNIINTKGDENGPFLASDGVTLYFSSDRLGGLGKNDIYMSRRLDESWTNWSTPVNLGPSVNTNAWDAYYTIAASGNYAYMVSSKNSLGGSDLVRMKLKDEVKPKPVVLINGKVFNAKTKEPIDATISYQLLADGLEMGTARSNPSNGDYKIVLPYGRNYGFSAKADGFIAVSDNMDLSDVADYKEINRDLYLVPIEIGEVVRLNNIFFDLAKATLRPESFPELDRVVKYMLDNPTMEIAMAGHTDNIGSDDANLTLSADRSKAVKDYIVSKGITENRITSNGFGESKPIASNETDDGRQLNRRVEFTILKK